MRDSLAPRMRPPKQGSSGAFGGVNVFGVGGGIRGPALVDELHRLCSKSGGRAKLRGIIGDNTSIHPENSKRIRYTCYKEFEEHEDDMRERAIAYDLPFYCDIVSKQYQQDEDGLSAFEQWLYHEALCVTPKKTKKTKILFVMACFGQRWGKSTLKICDGWFINTHPVAHGSVWDLDNYCRGPVPYEKMHLQEQTHCDLVAHCIDNRFDVGRYVDRVGPYELIEYTGPQMYYRRDNVCVKRRAQGAWVYAMHKLMCKPTKNLVCKIFDPTIEAILDGEKPNKKTLKVIRSQAGKTNCPG